MDWLSTLGGLVKTGADVYGSTQQRPAQTQAALTQNQPTGGGGIPPTYLYIGGGILALILVVVLIRR